MEKGRDLTIPPRRVDVARWVMEAEKDMTTDILQNAWNRNGLKYFVHNNHTETNTEMNTEMAGVNAGGGDIGEAVAV